MQLQGKCCLLQSLVLSSEVQSVHHQFWRKLQTAATVSMLQLFVELICTLYYCDYLIELCALMSKLHAPTEIEKSFSRSSRTGFKVVRIGPNHR